MNDRERAEAIAALFGKAYKGGDCIEDKSLSDVVGTIEHRFLAAVRAEGEAAGRADERKMMQAGATGEPITCPTCGERFHTPGNLDIALSADKEWRKKFAARLRADEWKLNEREWCLALLREGPDVIERVTRRRIEQRDSRAMKEPT